MFNPKKKEKQKRETRFSLPGGRRRRHSDLGNRVIMECEDVMSGCSSQGPGATAYVPGARRAPDRSSSFNSFGGRELRLADGSSSGSLCADGQQVFVCYVEAPFGSGDAACNGRRRLVQQLHGSVWMFYST